MDWLGNAHCGCHGCVGIEAILNESLEVKLVRGKERLNFRQ